MTSPYQRKVHYETQFVDVALRDSMSMSSSRTIALAGLEMWMPEHRIATDPGWAPGPPSPTRPPRPGSSDTVLIRKCLRGNEETWGLLVEKYSRLVYSIPLKLAILPENAADILQAVFLDLLNSLARFRRVDSLRPWLVMATLEKCLQWRKKQAAGADDPGREPGETTALAPARLLEELEQEQVLREAVSALPAGDQEMVQALFYGPEPMPYAEVAQRAASAPGGHHGHRCLKNLCRKLAEMGFARADGWPSPAGGRAV